MQFINLAAQQERIKETIDRNIQAVLAHGQYVMGPEIGALEERLAAWVGVRHALACASGTDALLMALMARGIGPGDAVFTTPFTFVATAEVIRLVGAVPVFVDIDPQTCNIDCAGIGTAIRELKGETTGDHPLPQWDRASGAAPAPRAVIAVDLFGLPADYAAIESLAGANDLFLVEDAAQSFGAAYGGARACSFGDVACTSFFPAKPLGCYGDGGMCFTNDDRLIEVLQSLRIHGQAQHRYDNVRVGINGRMDTLQAAILQAKFDIFPEEVALRQEVAARYADLLEDTRGSLVLPQVPAGSHSAWAQYSLLAPTGEQRAAIQDALKKRNIPTAIYYPKPLHLQEAFADLGYGRGDFPVSEDFAARIFSIPMHPYLTVDDQERITAEIRKAIA